MPTGIIEIQDEVNVKLLGIPQGLMANAQQALTYHVPGFHQMPKYRMGWWDGTISLLSPTGKTYLNLIDAVMPIFESAGYDFVIEDHRADWSNVLEQIVIPDENLFAEYTWKDGTPIILRDYQLAAIKAALTTGQGLLELATGAGKTLICAALAKVYSQFGKVIIIVPDVGLVLQTQSLFKRVGLDVGIWYADVKDDRQITISTWQSLEHVPELFAGTVCCIVDEAHKAKAKVISEIMAGPACNVPFRFGCTGTVPKEELFKSQIAGTIGRAIFELKAWELQDAGVLASSDVYQISLNDRGNPQYVRATPFEDWSDYLNWIFVNPERMRLIADIIIDAAENYGNTLVLVPHRAHGKLLHSLIPGSVSLDGKDKATFRRDQYEEFNERDGAVLICTDAIASTGLDIPRINVLCFIEPGKKFEKIIQTVGRGLRKADDKDHVRILDIHGNADMAKKHAAARKKLYLEAKIPCYTEDLSYADT